MAKKRQPRGNRKRSDTTFKFRCWEADVKAFRIASEKEGFAGNVAAWMLFHLRRIAKEKRD